MQNGSMAQKNDPRRRTIAAQSSMMQNNFPYLMKKKFVPLENQMLKLGRYEHEGERDPIL